MSFSADLNRPQSEATPSAPPPAAAAGPPAPAAAGPPAPAAAGPPAPAAAGPPAPPAAGPPTPAGAGTSISWTMQLCVGVVILLLAVAFQVVFRGGFQRAPVEKPYSYTLYSPEELAKYDGRDPGGPVYLALFGEVFDVTRGRRHYGKGGGYNAFAGKDGTRAFTTGQFDEKGLVPDTAGLTSEQMTGLHSWYEFYKKDYGQVGYLTGFYYNTDGSPTENRAILLKQLSDAKIFESKSKQMKQDWPGCNSRWSEKDGRVLWCSKMSGGVQRDWVGRPREFFSQVTNQKRCVCVDDSRIDDPLLQEYDNCDPKAESCSWTAAEVEQMKGKTKKSVDSPAKSSTEPTKWKKNTMKEIELNGGKVKKKTSDAEMKAKDVKAESDEKKFRATNEGDKWTQSESG